MLRSDEMPSTKDLARLALDLADTFRREAIRTLLDVADGDQNAVLRALDVVRQTNPDARQSERGTEHIAFSLLTEVFDQVAKHRPTSPR